MLVGYSQFIYFVFLCLAHICGGEKNSSIVFAVKNCVVSENASFLGGIIGHLFSDESDDKVDYYFSVCGFKTEENSSVSLNQSIIAVSDSSVEELGSFTNFSVSNKGDRHLVRFNNSDSITDLILGCGSMAAFHLISHENDKSYSFDLFHPSLCSTRHSVKYAFMVILLCFISFIIGYCVLSCLIKKCLYGRSWYQSIPLISGFENIKNRFQDYIVLHYHRPQTRLLEPVYMPVPNDSPEQFKTAKNNQSNCENSLEQKQSLLSYTDEEQQQQEDDVLLAL
ncbi:unnamed protein product [Schistosoma turkestanicum]|nr:unnamed protein product [Schistosoma turkestanicum]